MLTERQIHLIRKSFAGMASDADGAAAVFYRRLTELDPRLRFLFPEDLAAQRHRLVFSMGFIVRRIHEFAAIEHHLRNLGARHASYGVQPADYHTFRDAMYGTLGERFELEAETQEAWAALFDMVSSTMLAGAKDRDASDQLTVDTKH